MLCFLRDKIADHRPIQIQHWVSSIMSQIVIFQNRDKTQIKHTYELTDTKCSHFHTSYLNAIVEDFLPDHVTFISCGHNVQQPARSKDEK